MTSLSETPSTIHTPSCKGHYQPYLPPWLWLAYFIFVLVYLLFGIIVQNVNLIGPVIWIDWYNSHFQMAVLPSPESPFIRAILNIFSPAVLFHIGMVYLIANFLANRTTVSFLQNFYGMENKQEASDFLSRLQSSVGVSNSRSEQTKSKAPHRPGFLSIIILLIAPLLFFGMLTLFTVLISLVISPVANLSYFYYIFLAFLLIILWVSLIILTLLVTRDYQEQALAMSQRVPFVQASLLVSYFLVFMIMLFFPLFWMAIIYVSLAVLNIPSQTIAFSLLFILSLVFVGEVIWIFILPRQQFTKKENNKESEKQEPQYFNFAKTGPRLIALTEGYQVVVTESNAQFCRVLGPGSHYLNAHEYIYMTLNLHQHDREMENTYHTWDGIRVQVKVGVTFRLASNDQSPEPGLAEEQNTAEIQTGRPTHNRLYPFGEKAVRQAAYIKTVLDTKGQIINDWEALPLSYAQNQLKMQIASLRYDELFDTNPEEHAQAPHPRLRRLVLEKTQAALNQNKTGIHIIEVRLGPIKAIDTNVIAEHIATWRTREVNQIEQQGLSSQTEAITERITAHQTAEWALIKNLINGINIAEEKLGPDVSQRIIKLRMIAALERMGMISPSFKLEVLKELLAQINKVTESTNE